MTAHTRHTHRRGQRAFTLVELMVALTGGLFVSVMVFTLAKDGSRFYMRESRISDATLASVSGFERLRSDLSRISFLASSNVRFDAANGRLCGNPITDNTWPAGLRRLAGLRIQPATPTPNAALAANGLAPDSILIAGNFTGVDVFPMVGVQVTGTGYRVDLQKRIGPLMRLDYDSKDSAAQALILKDLFRKGTALRIVDSSGTVQYGTIADTNTVGGPAVLLSLTPNLRMRGSSSTLCGLNALSDGYVNVVNFVEYQVRALDRTAATGYENLYTAGATPWDANRTELVRRELDVTGTPIAGTEEIAAEYAVDMRFGLTVVQTFVGNMPSLLATVPAGNAAIPNWAGDITTTASGATQGPQFVRGLRVRLAIRSREPDRDLNIAGAATGPVAPGLYRFSLAANGASQFARVRTLQADIALHNQTGNR
ncbi:MAG TPA: prepilin-type N-terminal cleavage/methylation domain-containing protein [Polyangiaceae bacterium]|nr:prepilin-type N-terminal cleavage/methylation domain-containing protein [Polyangiaceae bacterium]